jgi:hypothetical protein
MHKQIWSVPVLRYVERHIYIHATSYLKASDSRVKLMAFAKSLPSSSDSKSLHQNVTKLIIHCTRTKACILEFQKHENTPLLGISNNNT